MKRVDVMWDQSDSASEGRSGMQNVDSAPVFQVDLDDRFSESERMPETDIEDNEISKI